MKRIALLLAAVGLGTGCIIETTGNQGNADLYWSFWWSPLIGDFGDVQSTADEVCAMAGVDEIEITLVDPAGDVRAPTTGGCVTGSQVPGARLVDLEAGYWRFSVAGYRGGVLVFSDPYPGDPWPGFHVYDGDTTVVDAYLQANHRDLRIDYVAETCEPGDVIDFDLYATDDLLSPFYSTYRGPNPPVGVPCSTSLASMIVPSVPAGVYAFGEWVQLDSTGVEVAWSDCSPTWTQSAFVDATVGVQLVAVPTGGYCAP